LFQCENANAVAEDRAGPAGSRIGWHQATEW